jgi:fatty-acyl-CoA synthase
VVIGGSACPRAITKAFQDDYGVDVIHAWGMTEMSPLGTLCSIKPEYSHLTGEEKLDLQAKQGHPPFSVEMKITDDENNELPWDGKTFGRLKVRGPAVSSSYYKGRGAEQFDAEGWFDTGDVAHVDPHGYMQITDRAKDVIKSGGEWISSIDIENLAVGTSRCCRSRGDRRRPPEMGRTAAAGCRCQGRTVAEQGVHSRIPRRQDRQMVDAGRRDVH